MVTGTRLRIGLGLAALGLLGGVIAPTSALAIQQATPTVAGEAVDPALCVTDDDDMARLVALAGETAVPEPGGRDNVFESELPQGESIDADTLAEITEVEQTFAACYNAGNLAGAVAVMTDETAALMLDEFGDEIDLAALTPSELNSDEWIVLFPLRGTRELEDGRVGAIVEWGRSTRPASVDEMNFRMYEQVDGDWLLAGEIPVRDMGRRT